MILLQVHRRQVKEVTASRSRPVCLSRRLSGCLHPRGICFPLRRCSGLSAALYSAVFITKRCWFGGEERAGQWGSECRQGKVGGHGAVGVNTKGCPHPFIRLLTCNFIFFSFFPLQVAFFPQRDSCTLKNDSQPSRRDGNPTGRRWSAINFTPTKPTSKCIYHTPHQMLFFIFNF